jgi:hypothetical protein
MIRGESAQWDSAALWNDSRAWFVTAFPGKFAGAPDDEMLFVVEIPRSHCLLIRLFHPSPGWEYQALSRLAAQYPSPDVLITDHTRLQHPLVSAGASFEKPATAYLHKPITLMPAIAQCIRSLVDVLTELMPSHNPTDGINAKLEAWRIAYNSR